MKNRAFTITEVITALVIVGILALVGIPIIMRLVREHQDKTYDIQVNSIIESAKAWAVTNINELPYKNGGKINITVQELIDERYIEYNVKNPINDEIMDGCVIITYNTSSNQHTYEYSEEC